MMNNVNPFKKIAYNFKQIDEAETEIEIYDVISDKKSYNWWTGEEGTEVTPSDFKEQLEAVNTPNVTIRMNSGGGEVFAANVIAVAITEAVNRGKKIACKIDGVCASAAVQIATACSEVIMHQSALLMIHNPMTGLCGYYDAHELKKAGNMLTATKDAIINHYTDKTGLSRQKLSNMMDEETWMDGKEAVEKGFADKLMFDDTVNDDTVYNRIKNAVTNTAFNIPQSYQTAINQIKIPDTKGENTEMEIKTVQDLKENYADLVNELKAEYEAEIKNAAREEGVNAERARIQAIDEMQGKVSPEMLNKAKYETFDTAEKVAMDAIKNNAFVQTGVLVAMAAETAPANEVKGLGNDGLPQPTNTKQNETEKASNAALAYLKKLGKVE